MCIRDSIYAVIHTNTPIHRTKMQIRLIHKNFLTFFAIFPVFLPVWNGNPKAPDSG